MCTNTFGQICNFECVQFYDYDTVMRDLAEHGKKSDYFKDIDYEAMLLLDISSFNVLMKVDSGVSKYQKMVTQKLELTKKFTLQKQ